jgi:predicted Zn-dependent protease with MMP-like domain
MRRSAFRRLVSDVLEDLPQEFLEKMENLEIVVEGLPTPEQEALSGGESEDGLLLGLYEGTPLPERDSAYGGTLPDKITIFQDNIEAVCESEDEMAEEIRKTVLHEIAHHFGMEDDRLEELDY